LYDGECLEVVLGFSSLMLVLWSPSYFGYWPLAIQVFDGISLIHMEVGWMGPIL
jgi:hypothetical protein